MSTAVIKSRLGREVRETFQDILVLLMVVETGQSHQIMVQNGET